ncbi:tetratricopeptide repeat protein [Pseudomonas sp. NPDC089530]|uniref:tetratricopeptide repeat protein n=1 Tax=Pseudomonas sp. NPDC089530 TaxID=3390651 RepID=UPI003D03C961
MPTKSFLPGLILALCAVASHCSVAAERKASQQSNNASTTLIESASQQYADGQLDQAAATLERALHIQPNNPATLHYLGVLRLQQGQYQQAQALATRSNMRVGQNVALRNRNIQLIQAAQKALASNNPPNADEPLVAVREGLEEEVKRRREAEAVAARQPAPEAAQSAVDRPAGGTPGAEGQLPMVSAEPAPTYDEIEIPRGHRPPPGKCRIWFPDRPPGHQPAPGKCKKLRYRVPFGAYLLQG